VEIDERCRAFDEELSALIDGELDARRRAEVEVHVAGCAGCARRLAALRSIDAALRSLPSPAVPSALRARLDRRLAAERAEPGTRRVPPPSARRWRGLLGVALPAAAAAAAVALYLALRAPDPSGQTPEPAPIAKAPLVAPAEPEAEPRIAEAEPEPPAASPSPAPVPRIAERPPQSPGVGELEALDTEDLAVVLDLDTIEDLPVIANLEVLERLLHEDAG
jgi:anti-sigma factor RsiW